MLEESKIWKIGGSPIYTPSVFTVSMEDLEVSAERTADGVLHRERARQGVRKVSFTYDAMTQEEIAALLPRMSADFFTLTYPDPESGTKTITCYSAKKEAELYTAVYYGGLWRSVKFNCIEK